MATQLPPAGGGMESCRRPTTAAVCGILEGEGGELMRGDGGGVRRRLEFSVPLLPSLCLRARAVGVALLGATLATTWWTEIICNKSRTSPGTLVSPIHPSMRMLNQYTEVNAEAVTLGDATQGRLGIIRLQFSI